MKKFRVETKQASSDIWNGECEIIEAESALEAATLISQWVHYQMIQHGDLTTSEIMEELNNTQFRVSNTEDYTFSGIVFNYEDLK